MPYIVALDQGTTSFRAIIFDHDAAIVGVVWDRYQANLPGVAVVRRAEWHEALNRSKNWIAGGR